MTSENSYFSIKGYQQRTIVIGDIHGCYDELKQLLEQVKFNQDDVLICVGDLVDRGPKSWEVVRFFKETENAYSVLGNHERRLAGTVKGTSIPAWTQRHTLSQLPESQWMKWADWFEKLPAVIGTDHAIVCHSRLDPEIKITRQNPYYTCAVGGASIKIEKDQSGIPLWFYAFDFQKPICIGHETYDRVELVKSRLYALDTDAVKGHKLTALILPEGDIRSVSVLKNYKDEALFQWNQEKKRRILSLKTEELNFHKIVQLMDRKTDLSQGTDYVDEINFHLFNRLTLFFEQNPIEPVLHKAREHLFEHFGLVPEDNASKGDYFKNVRNSYANRIQGNLAVKLLTGKYHELKCFELSMGKKSKLNDFYSSLRDL